MTAVADEIQLDETAFRGSILRPGAPDYDVHRRIWNGSFDRRPAMIVRCAGVADVIAAGEFGRGSGPPGAGRGGGGFFPGPSLPPPAPVIAISPRKGGGGGSPQGTLAPP